MTGSRRHSSPRGWRRWCMTTGTLARANGEPRQEIDPWRQVRDYRDAITFAETLGETDKERIGIWGSSYSGAHVLVVGAIDRG